MPVIAVKYNNIELIVDFVTGCVIFMVCERCVIDMNIAKAAELLYNRELSRRDHQIRMSALAV